MTTGEKVKAVRKNSGLTQEELSRKIGVSQKQVAHIESGRRNLTPDRAKMIAKECNCRAEWLLGIDNYPTRKELALYSIDDAILDARQKERAFLTCLQTLGLDIEKSFETADIHGSALKSYDDGEIRLSDWVATETLLPSYVVKKDGETILTISQMQKDMFIHTLFEFAEFELQRLIKEV